MQIENEKILELNNISFHYGDDEILHDISLSVERGDYLGIIGPNGAGKTTLLRIVLGLMKPALGSVKLFGEDLKSFKDWRKVGYVPQKVGFDPAFPATVFEVVMMGRYAGKKLLQPLNNEDKRSAEEALKLVEMWDLKDRIIGDLSGGQQQRVFIARALAANPDILFLDEPTTGVDVLTCESFYALLKKFNEELKITIVLISHDVDMVVKEAKHIACIDHVLVCHERSQAFLEHSKLRDIMRKEVKIITHQHH